MARVARTKMLLLGELVLRLCVVLLRALGSLMQSGMKFQRFVVCVRETCETTPLDRSLSNLGRQCQTQVDACNLGDVDVDFCARVRS